MDPRIEAIELVKNLDQRMGPSPYDIAWLARLQNPGTNISRWPDLIEWLLNNQHPDGSWGGQVLYYHDRIICTLAAAIALAKNGQSPRVEKAIQRAERYLWHHLHLLHRDPFELVGFELIFPTLIMDARNLRLDVPPHTCGYGKIQAEKLHLIPPQMIYSPRISTVHSLEFLGQSGDLEQLREALAVNGSLGNSPAATAYYLTLDHNDERALAYLEATRNHSTSVIYLYPFRTFELVWVLNNLAFCDVPITEFADQPILETLHAEMTPLGIGLDPTFGITDGDITSVCTRLLVKAGYAIDPHILAQFQETHIFRTYEYERNASVGTNVHALEALRLMPDYPNRQRVREQIKLMLLDNRHLNMYWIDKWHISPFYATMHVLAGLLKEDACFSDACENTVDWLLHIQRQDGSWGFFENGTVEETAYVLIALLQYNRHRPISSDILHQGAAYLTRAYQELDSAYPELWIGKCLYAPQDVIRSAILAAHILYEETYGRSPG